MSRLTIASVVVAAICVAPAVVSAESQECRDGISFQTRSCVTKPSGVWTLSFGEAKLPSPPPVMRPMHHGITTVAAAEREAVQQMPSPGGWFVDGLKLIPMAGPAAPIDCRMQKAARPGPDRAMVHQVHGQVRHSAVIVPVAPCRK